MIRSRLAFAAGLVLLLVACNNGALQKPTIASFAADPSTLPAGGGSATLKWDVSGAETVSIDNGVGTVMGNTKAVNVTSTTTFTLTATNLLGSSSERVTVTVADQPGPKLEVAPKTATVSAGGGKMPFTATLKNASGDIAWKLSPELGTLSAKTGPSVDYIPPASIDKETAVTLTAASGTLSDSATITVKSSASTGITVNGKVSDLLGNGLANIPVRIVDAGGPKDLVNTDASGNFTVNAVKTPYSVSAVSPLTNGTPTTWEGVTRPDPKLVVSSSGKRPTCTAHTLSGRISPAVGAGHTAEISFVAPGISLVPLGSNAGQFLTEGANTYKIIVDLGELASVLSPAPRCQDAYTGFLIYQERDSKGAVVRTAILSNISTSAGSTKTQDIAAAPAQFTTLSGRVSLPSDFGGLNDIAQVKAILKLGSVSYPLAVSSAVMPGSPDYSLSVPIFDGAQYRVKVDYTNGMPIGSFVYSDVLGPGGTANLTLPNLGKGLEPNNTASSPFPTFRQTPATGSNLYQVFMASAPLQGTHDTEWNGYSSGPSIKLPDLPTPARLVSGKRYQWVVASFQLRGFGIDDLLDGRLVLGDFGENNPDAVVSGSFNYKTFLSFVVP